ncbi:ABC transporter permease [Halovenus marina]|uniref:ABC transporter permease n=1 Tax=Halovenus marina TaxID=3396621 RepID=UPI003F54CEE2
MSWRVIAKKDFQDAVRSRAFLAISGLFLLLIVGMTALFGVVEEISGEDPTALDLVFFIASSLGLFVSIVAIVVCYRAIAGERESGSIKLLLALPHTRRDVVLGKLVGRTAVIAVPVVVSLVIGLVAGGLMLGDIAPVATILFCLVALLFALTYVSIMVGFSAVSESTTRAAALSIGFFIVVEFLWDVVVLGLAYVANDFSFPQTTADFPAWIFPVSQLQPSTAFVNALVAVMPDPPDINGGTGPGAEEFDAFFATPWLAFVALAFWILISVALGYRRFQRADL